MHAAITDVQTDMENIDQKCFCCQIEIHKSEIGCCDECKKSIMFDFLVFIIHGTHYNVLLKNERETACKHLLKQLCSQTEFRLSQSVIGIHTCGYIQYIIAYETVKHDIELYETLQLMDSQLKLSHHSPLILNLIQLANMLTNYKLLLKYIIRVKSNVFEKFLLVILHTLRYHLDSFDTEQLGMCMKYITGTCKYWMQKHFFFIIKNGFCVVLTKCLKKMWRENPKQIREDWIKNKGIITAEVLTIGSTALMFAECCFVFIKNMQLNAYMNDDNGVLNYFENRLKVEMLKVSIVKRKTVNKCKQAYFETWYAKIHPKNKLPIDHSLIRGHSFSVSQCAWVMCGKVRRKLYKCKACRLVYYCCRNHQKKHWKLIHSNQCMIRI
eukprot:361495_1